ncbi:MAG: LamG-like jellyroll fold domain-containing protein [Bacteroidota bacterium]
MKQTLLILFTLLSGLTFAQIPSYVPQNGLRGFYPFSGNANDASTYGSHLTNSGAVLTTDRHGYANSAYSFNGINQSMTRTTQNFTLTSTGSFTISIWIKKPNTTGGVALIHGTTAANNFIWLLQGGTTNLTFATNKQQSAWINAPTSGINIGTWEHYLMVYDAGAMSTYRNGVLEGTNTFTYTNVTSANLPLYIGKGISGGYFPGDMDDLGIWDRALTTCEINDLYTETNTIVGVGAGSDTTICQGSSVTLTGSGASTYVWNQGVINGTSVSPNSTTTYAVTGMDGSGCSAWDEITVTIDPISIDAGLNQTICAGDTVTLTGSGGISYSWNNGVVNNAPFVPSNPGTYTVVGANAAGCTRADSLSIFINPVPVINGGMDTSICEGSSVTLSASGGNFITWNNGIFNNIAFTPTSTMSYIVTGTNGFNCPGSDTVTVTVNQPTTSTLTINAMDQYVLNGTTYTASGTYTQTIPNAAGCDSLITLNLSLDFTGISENSSDDINWFPNPAVDHLNINVNAELANNEVQIYNLNGKLVKTEILHDGLNELDVQNLPSGEYICVFAKMESANFKWMKK